MASCVESRIVGEEFDFEDVEAVELREKVRRRIGDVRKRVARPIRFAMKKTLVSTGKIEVVHLAISGIDVTGRCGAGGCREKSGDQENRYGKQLHAGTLWH